jgi:hypothetical protein
MLNCWQEPLLRQRGSFHSALKIRLSRARICLQPYTQDARIGNRVARSSQLPQDAAPGLTSPSVTHRNV